MTAPRFTAGFLPADVTAPPPLASAATSPGRAGHVHSISSHRASSGACLLVPTACAQHNPDHREHDRHFDQHADDSRQRRSRLKAEQRDRRGDRELEEIGGADQGRWTGDVVRHTKRAVDPVGDAAMYLEPFRGLANHPIGAVRRWAARTILQLERAMSAAREEEDEEHAAWE